MKGKISLLLSIIFIFVALAACAPQPAEPQTSPSPSPSPSPVDTTSPTPTEEDNDPTPGENGDNTGPEQLEDGIYEGRSEADERGNYGEVKIKVANGKITEVEYTEYQKDDKPKSEETGYEYKEALEAFEELPKRLVEAQDINEVDDYSGATSTSKHFKEAVKEALKSGPATDDDDLGDKETEEPTEENTEEDTSS